MGEQRVGEKGLAKRERERFVRQAGALNSTDGSRRSFLKAAGGVVSVATTLGLGGPLFPLTLPSTTPAVKQDTSTYAPVPAASTRYIEFQIANRMIRSF